MSSLLHVLTTSVTKQLGGTRRLGDSPRLLHDQIGRRSRVRAVLEERLERAREHLFKPYNQHAVRGAVCNHIPAHVQTGGSSGAVVIDIVDGNASHTELVKYTLSACRVAVAIACNALVNIVVVDVGIEHGLDTGFEAKLRVVYLSTGLDEL